MYKGEEESGRIVSKKWRFVRNNILTEGQMVRHKKQENAHTHSHTRKEGK